MEDKDIIASIKLEGDKLTPNSFEDVQKRLKLTDKGICNSIKVEAEQLVPNQVPTVEHKENHHWNFNPRVVGSLAAACVVIVAVPILVSSLTQPVAKCDAYVGVEMSDDDQTLQLRAEVNNDIVDLDSLCSVNETGNKFLSGIRHDKKFTNNPTLSTFISESEKIAKEYNLLDGEVKNNFHFVFKDENVLNKYSTTYSTENSDFMGKGTALKLIDFSVTVFDITNRLFSHDKFTPFIAFDVIRDSFNNGVNLEDLAAKLTYINMILPKDSMVEAFKKDISLSDFVNQKINQNSIIEFVNSQLSNFENQYNDNHISKDGKTSYWSIEEISNVDNINDYWNNYWYNELLKGR